ncbi:DUF4189 domain-containing protein [bacterium]|nr:DUF4189 domain-containing protein [bacterium]
MPKPKVVPRTPKTKGKTAVRDSIWRTECPFLSLSARIFQKTVCFLRAGSQIAIFVFKKKEVFYPLTIKENGPPLAQGAQNEKEGAFMKKQSVLGLVCALAVWSGIPMRADDNSSGATVKVCNDSQSSEAYIAVRFFENNEWRTQGWWEVKKNSCRQVGNFPSNQAIYVLATSNEIYPEWAEYTPSADKVLGCVNPDSRFDYAELNDGSCEARESIPEDAPAPQKIAFGKLVEAGYRGVAEFRFDSTFIALFQSPTTGEIGMGKDKKSTEAEVSAKAACGKADCEQITVIRDMCLAFATEDLVGSYGWGQDAQLETAKEIAMSYCRENAEKPELCRVVASDCP